MASSQEKPTFHQSAEHAVTAERIGILSTSSTTSVLKVISSIARTGDRSIAYVIDGGERSETDRDGKGAE